tara:strand:+ start:155 stop:736 length:582 start_codon:yes stop_codon:yes gene_type:complete
MKSCLLLGNSKYLKKINFYLKKKNFKTKIEKKKINIKIIKKFDLVISFGYKFILKKSLLKFLKRPAINLHISYLPYNRGAHPNFWSFFDNTPSGITIHEIDQGVDTGKIIFQKKIFFNVNKNKNLTFKSTYKTLNEKIVDLFIKKADLILKKKYSTKKQNNKISTFHLKKELPSYMNNWNMKILSVKKKYGTK